MTHETRLHLTSYRVPLLFFSCLWSWFYTSLLLVSIWGVCEIRCFHLKMPGFRWVNICASKPCTRRFKNLGFISKGEGYWLRKDGREYRLEITACWECERDGDSEWIGLVNWVFLLAEGLLCLVIWSTHGQACMLMVLISECEVGRLSIVM